MKSSCAPTGRFFARVTSDDGFLQRFYAMHSYTQELMGGVWADRNSPDPSVHTSVPLAWAGIPWLDPHELTQHYIQGRILGQ